MGYERENQRNSSCHLTKHQLYSLFLNNSKEHQNKRDFYTKTLNRLFVFSHFFTIEPLPSNLTFIYINISRHKHIQGTILGSFYQMEDKNNSQKNEDNFI